MDELMKEILEYALKKAKKELEYAQNIDELFTKEDNLEYRKSFYELGVTFKKGAQIKHISFKEYCKNFEETSKKNITKLLGMIKRIEHQMSGKSIQSKGSSKR